MLRNEFVEKEKGEKLEAEEEEIEEVLTEDKIEDLEDEQITKEIEKLKEEEAKELKKKRKRVLKQRAKLNEKMNLKMVLKGDEGPKLEEEGIFTLEQIKTNEDLNAVTDQHPDLLAESDVDSDDELKKPKKMKYDKESSQHLAEETENEDSEEEDSDSDKSSLGLESEDEKKEKTPKKVRFKEEEEFDNPLITDLDPRDKKTKKEQKADMWFERDVFKNLENEKVEDIEIDKMLEIYKKKGGVIIGDKSQSKNKKEESEDSDYDSDYDVNEVLAPEIKSKKIRGKDGFEIVAKETGK